MPKFRWETEFKETEIGEVPRDWEVVRLGEVLDSLVKGKPPIKEYKGKGDFPYLSAKYLRGEEEILDFYSEKAGCVVDEKDILILWDGANAGEIFKGKKGLLASTMCKLNLKENVNSYFIFLFLKQQEEDIKEAKSGTDDRHVDKDFFFNLLIPLPPPDEQARIATVLSWFDDLIENKKKQNEILEKTAMAIFKSWFVDFEPFKDEEFVYNEEVGREIPKGWEVKALGSFTEIIMGQSPPSSHYNEEGRGLPFIQGKGQYGRFTPETNVYCSKSVKVAKPCDVLITVRAPVGELNLADGEYVIGRGVASLRNRYWAFLFLYLLTNNEKLKSYERGTTYDAITREELNSFPILLPPLPILQRFHSFVEPLFQKIILNQKEIMVLRKIRDVLLPELVFGKLRVEEI